MPRFSEKSLKKAGKKGDPKPDAKGANAKPSKVPTLSSLRCAAPRVDGTRQVPKSDLIAGTAEVPDLRQAPFRISCNQRHAFRFGATGGSSGLGHHRRRAEAACSEKAAAAAISHGRKDRREPKAFEGSDR